jgi:CHAT domain-containing protein
LIQPARKLLAGKQELIIVPDGILHYLPFEVLLQSGGVRTTQGDMRRWPYLVRDYAISYVPSASVLASLMRDRDDRQRPEKVFLAYADPAYGAQQPEETSAVGSAVRSAFGQGKPWKLKRLAWSRTEARRIARLYPAEEIGLFLGEHASEENVKAEGRIDQYRFVHFAAHGLLNENKPQYSGIVLTLPSEAGNPKSEIRNPKSETNPKSKI